jgi:DNA-binding NarL/FixJ family response regulator
MPTHVLLVDDSELIRTSLRSLLGSVEGIASIREAATLGEALDCAQCDPPTLVIMDLHLPDGFGMHIIHQLKQFAPLLWIAVLTNHSAPVYRQRCLDLGVDWFFDKTTEVEELLEVVRQQAAEDLTAEKPH